MRVLLVGSVGDGAFRGAEQLARRGVLSRLITTLPGARRIDVPRDLVSLHLLPEVLARGPLKLPWVRRWYPWEYVKAVAFGALAKREIADEDVVQAFSMFGLEVHRAARSRGAVTVLERGSSHILHQRRIVDRELERWGRSDRRLLHGRAIDRQLKEYEQADFVLVHSRYSWDSFVREGFPASKLLRAPMGVNLSRFQPSPKTDDVFRVLCVGEGPRKGVGYLLEAVRQLALPRSEVVWVGFGGHTSSPFAKQYREWFSPVGKVPNDQLHRYITQASVVVVPSLEDGWCLVVSEAMACGVPVICTDQTGAMEIVRDGVDGFVVPARNVDRLKEKLLYLYEHEEARAAMGRSALEHVKEFTWDRYGDSLVSEFNRALVNKRHPAAMVCAS